MNSKAATKSLLKLREKAKANKPSFIRQESWRYKRVKKRWRRPKGIDSKMRVSKKGWPRSPKTGYMAPKKARGLHPSGRFEVLVHNLRDLKNVDSEKKAVRIAHTVGKRKRLGLLEEAKKIGLIVLNPMKKSKAKTKETEEKEEKGKEENSK
ncbi:MAG: 50S ribosomal protein L32e [Candidatus Bathyarchaeota archaeon]